MPILQTQFTIPNTTYQPSSDGSERVLEKVTSDQPVNYRAMEREIYRQQVKQALLDWMKHMVHKFGMPRLPNIP